MSSTSVTDGIEVPSVVQTTESSEISDSDAAIDLSVTLTSKDVQQSNVDAVTEDGNSQTLFSSSSEIVQSDVSSSSEIVQNSLIDSTSSINLVNPSLTPIDLPTSANPQQSSELVTNVTQDDEQETLSNPSDTLPHLVYVQNPSKSASSPLPNNIMSVLPQNLTHNQVPQPIPMPPKNVILTKHPKSQKILLQNPNTLQTIPLSSAKRPLTYVTMIKSSKSISFPSMPNQKFVIASLPNTKEKLANTVTTNSVRPKLSILPMPSHRLLNKANAIQVKIAKPQALKPLAVMSRKITEQDSDLNNFHYAKNVIVRSDKSIEEALLNASKDLNTFPHNDIPNNSVIFPIPEYLITKPSIDEHPVISIPTVPPPQQKTERRRKPLFTCKQDYDEATLTDKSIISKLDLEKKRALAEIKNEDDMSITKLKVNIKPDINMNEDFEDINELLLWEDGIGYLPGSDLKFMYNKYKFLQILSRDEYIQVMNKKVSKCKIKEGTLEEMCCLQCGCYGLPSEFISPKYCSYACRDDGIKALKCKERNFRLRAYNCFKRSKIIETTKPKEMVVSNSKILKEESELQSNHGSDEESDSSQNGYSLPWNCSKKGFSWSKYLSHMQAKPAPITLFKDPFPYNKNGFKPGMKLEGIDPQHPSYFCVLSVMEVIGYRLRLHFDGYSENYDFWVNADSMDIFFPGWCEKNGHKLHPPPLSSKTDFNWTSYMKATRCILAPKHLFAISGTSAICTNGFRIGMKLEAVDRKNTSLICVSTITDMMDNRLLIHFDSWDDIYDYWVDPTSPFIHPVGWADKNGHKLTPPNDYKNPKNFSWESYLKDNKCVAAPARAFKQKTSCSFKKGMRLECVDKRVPRLIRVATIDDVKEHQVRVRFDGWRDRYSYWVDSDSSDIHPVGWCQKTGHPIEPPLTPADVYEFLDCPTVGCHGQGHIEGAQKHMHYKLSECPYSDENLKRKNILPDRLLSPDRQLPSIVPVSREPKEKRLNKTKRSRGSYNNDERGSKKMKTEQSELPLTNGYENDTEQLWEKHSDFLLPHLNNISNPEVWGQHNVAEFIASLPGCESYNEMFQQQCIDGHSLLMLTQKDLIDILNIKVGPAIKIYSIIVLLRRYSFKLNKRLEKK